MYGCNLSEFDGTEKIFECNDNIEIPNEFSYKNYMPRVLNQGEDPICVPCSISSYVDWKNNLKNGTKKSQKMDIEEMYNSRSTNENGMNVKEALIYLRDNGVTLGNGENFKIRDFSKVGNKFSLMNSIIVNGPCIGVLPVYSEYGYDDFWNEEYGDFLGFHAISFVGYTEEGFILRNSWGSSYGRDGYFILPSNDFNHLKELWTIEG